MTRRISALLLAASLGACGGERDSDARQSAARVLRAEETVRNAANSEKARVLRQLAGACSTPESCAVQQQCHAAYQLHIDGLGLTAAARQRLTDGDAPGAAKLLGPAEQKLNEARGRVSDCTERAAALRRRYKL